MPLIDTNLIALMHKAADALDAEAAWIVDVETVDHGRSKPSIPTNDRGYYDAVTEQAQRLRDLVAMIEARQHGQRSENLS